MCRMSPLSQPRSLRMLSHEHRPCVSKSRRTNKTTPTAIFVHLKTTHIRIAQRCDQPTRPATPALPIHTTRCSPIENT
jgi:hypothetical protein